MRWFVLILIVIFSVTGCNLVTIRSLPGETPLKISASDWEGIWYDGDKTVIFISVKDAVNGILSVKAVDGDSEKLKVKKFSLFLRKGKDNIYGGILFGEIADKDEINDSNRDRYVWGIIKLLNGRILYYNPDGKRFRGLVEKGLLSGKAGKGYVHLDSDWKEVERAVKGGKQGGFYETQSPLILSRIK